MKVSFYYNSTETNSLFSELFILPPQSLKSRAYLHTYIIPLPLEVTLGTYVGWSLILETWQKRSKWIYLCVRVFLCINLLEAREFVFSFIRHYDNKTYRRTISIEALSDLQRNIKRNSYYWNDSWILKWR